MRHFVFAVVLLVLPCLCPAVTAATAGAEVDIDGSTTTTTVRTQRPLTKETKERIQVLEQKVSNLHYADPKYGQIWEEILQLNPTHYDATLQLGLVKLTGGDAERGITLLERVFFKEFVSPRTIPMPSFQGYTIAMVIGRYRWEQRNYEKPQKFLKMALETALSSRGQVDETCAAVSLATMLHPFPNSTEQADEMLDRYMTAAQHFLDTYKQPKMNEEQLSQSVVGAAPDPYTHCHLTIFHLSFYYRADVAKAASYHSAVAQRVWPQLAYQSPLFPAKAPKTKTCTTKKIKLGIASGLMSHESPVSSDFKGVLQLLDRSKFDITYLYFTERGGSQPDQYVFKHREDKFMMMSQLPEQDEQNATWVGKHYPVIEALDLDILLYLDLTMSPHATRVAMARLARVQATSHGHPTTSGVPAIDYYISWGAAELPTAAAHYSEELVLLNAKVPHQYYQPRHDEQGRSKLNGQSYHPVNSRSTFATVPNDGHWYTCMQKPHKFMPEMDPLLCGVLQGDPEGRLILHQPDTMEALQSFQSRLKRAGCDNSRVHFLPSQDHHKLLALYNQSDVLLDSYPAGGCTTTREALEIGTVVVTLPARLLGGRWTYAYYQMLNDEELNSHVIAASPEEYIAKAVALGTDEILRDRVEGRIQKFLPRLYNQRSAVESWEQALEKISPVTKQSTCP